MFVHVRFSKVCAWERISDGRERKIKRERERQHTILVIDGRAFAIDGKEGRKYADGCT